MTRRLPFPPGQGIEINTEPHVILSTAQLKKLCDQAERLHFDRGPNAKFWEDVDPCGHHVTDFWFVHRPVLAMWKGVKHPWNFEHGGGKNIRASILCKMRGKKEPAYLICDFDHDAFMALVRKARRQATARVA